MKKFLFVTFVVFLIFTTACDKKLTTYTEITYAEYMEKINNQDTFPMVIGSEICDACALYKGTMESFIKENQIEVFYIDIYHTTEEEYNNLKAQVNFDGTPTTIFIEEGKITSFYNRIDGSGSYSTIKKKFEENGYFKK